MRRITERSIAKSEQAAAAEIIAQERHGSLEGVEIDFRHPGLSDEWVPRPQWYVAGNSPFLFPEQSIEFVGDERLPLIEARHGDKITVERVIPQIVEARLDHPHDRQCQLVFLKIERPSGEVVTASDPLPFYGRTQVREGPTREAFDHILERICAHAGISEISEGGWQQWDWSSPLEQIARRFGADAHDSYFRALVALGDNEQAKASLRELANSAALAGFLLAKVELRKAEAVGVAIERNRQQGTAKVTRLDWREKAKELRAAHPDYKRNRVANMIAEGTDDDPRSILRAIKPLWP